MSLMSNYTHLNNVVVQGYVESSTQGKLIGSFETMPAATDMNKGQVVLYMGTTTSTYTKGKYYVSTGTAWVLSDSSPASISVDSSLSTTSTNPVQNKVITNALAGKVDTVPGKALSTNDYTTAEKTKVSNLPDNATTTFATKTELTDAVTSVYKYKGSVATYSALPGGAAVGDVYNVEAAYDNVPAGTNWAWNGSAWDALGGTVTGFVPNTRTVNGKALSADITLSASDVGALAVSGTAVKATADASGNNIVNTYATKDEVSAKQDKLVVDTNLDSFPTSGSTNPITSGGAFSAINTKVPASGTYDADAATITFKAASGAQLFQVTGIEGGGVQFTLEVDYTGASDLSGITVTATPISGATVTVQGTTNTSGKAYLTVKQNATYTISSSKSGYKFTSTPSVTCTDLTTVVAIECFKKPTVTVTVTDSSSAGLQSGRTIKMVGSGDTQTATTNSSGVCTFVAENTGSYTFSMTDVPTGASVADVSKTLNANTETAVAMVISFGYGFAAVDISLSDSNPATRCSYPQTITVNGVTVNNSCYGFTPASGASGSFAMNSWATHKILEGIQPVSKNGSTWKVLDTNAANWAANGSSEDYFTEFPFQWLSITKDSSKIRIIFSDKDAQPDSTFQCYAHAKGCDSYSNAQIESAVSSASRDAIMASNNNSYFANTFHIGCFGASGGASGAAIYSKKATTYATSINYVYFWQGANARGDDYDCMSAQQWTYVQALFLLLYRSTDSQTAHSYGLANGSKDTGNAALSTTAYGMAGSASSARNAFFWIHDAWGNIYQFIGGMWNRAGSSSKLYYWLPRQANSRAFNNGWTAATTYATQASLGTDTGLACSNSGGYISTVAGSNTGGFFPTAQGGSATTYWPDRGIVHYDSSSAYFPYVGGLYDDATDAGIFYCIVSIYSTNSSSYYGARLSYRGGRTLA